MGIFPLTEGKVKSLEVPTRSGKTLQIFVQLPLDHQFVYHLARLERAVRSLGPQKLVTWISKRKLMSTRKFGPRELEELVSLQLKHALDDPSKIYKSLKNLSEVIGTEYGNRVLFELVQNAHDAHHDGDQGEIAIKLVVENEKSGKLFVANRGHGFTYSNLESLRHIGTSDKEIGEGIGNKGLGFRSVEALTDKPEIYSQSRDRNESRFTGYCFRFATEQEIKDRLGRWNASKATQNRVAGNISRYLVPLPLTEQSDEIIAYAKEGFATVIVLPLQSAKAVKLACEQVETLTKPDVPLMLFLDRIARVRIDIERPEQSPYRRRVSRRQKHLGNITKPHGGTIYKVDIGKSHQFLMVRRQVDKERVLEAVEKSTHRAPQLKRWLEWKGDPVVSIAVGLSAKTVPHGRLYNFLPMGEKAESPLIGYLDAPFYADINRSDANFDLPLNENLMEAAAEACAAAVLFIVESDLNISPQSVFDLFAWTGKHAKKFDEALKQIGSSLSTAVVIPTITAKSKKEWANLLQVRIWPEDSFKLLNDRNVAKHAGAQLVSKDLDSRRIKRLEEVAKRPFGAHLPTSRPLIPTADELAKWSELFAISLLKRKMTSKTWSNFYDDLPRLFKSSGNELGTLIGKKILYDRSKKLRPAGGHDDMNGVFFRSIPKGRRKKEGVPLPPATLARRYRFLDEKITFRRETLNAFIEANILREYEPMEALASLKSILGNNANDERHQEALQWAFRVWCSIRSSIDDELCEANLHVPTLSGWRSAKCTAFSSSWTPVGKMLENYLGEVKNISEDCQHAHSLLLISQLDWPVSMQDAKRDWMEFLKLIGVTDGLKPFPARLQRKGFPNDLWDHVCEVGNPSEGLDENWCAEVADAPPFKNPYTLYEMKGQAWRLPGQIEYATLPENARETFCALIFEHLKTHGSTYFQFEVGRFDRSEGKQHKRELPTPLATFLRSRAWVLVRTQEQEDHIFKRPMDCWASRRRRDGLPRFVDRVSTQMLGFSEDDEMAKLTFGDTLGLRDWQSQRTAVDRLRDLASIATKLAARDRPRSRSEYQRAWSDITEMDISLPSDLNLIVKRYGRLEVLSGDSSTPSGVVITDNAENLEAQMLSEAGQPVLEVGSASSKQIANLLEETGSYAPRCLDNIKVQLLVDGVPFVSKTDDPFLTSLGLSWLPEIIAIGHELLGEQLERGIQSSLVVQQMRAIRVRHCKTITLVVDDEKVSSSEQLPLYAFKHDDSPTLILNDDMVLGWKTLAGPVLDCISNLIDSRLRSLKLLLPPLALEIPSDDLDAPSDEVLARVIKCSVQTIQDHRAELRTSLEHILHLLIPVITYHGGRELGHQLQNDIDHGDTRDDVKKWLESHFSNKKYTPDELINACEEAINRSELRKQLDLDYERFNQALSALGETLLSNEAELRRLYEAHLVRLQPKIIERLRQHHAPDFRQGRKLTLYVERRSLDFLAFDERWIQTRETLEKDIVEAHVSHLLTEILQDAEDRSVKLPPLDQLIEANRKVVRKIAANALSVLRIWCRRNNVPLPEPWNQEEPQAIVLHLENRGLLDFESITAENVPNLCRRASCWPSGMPETLDEQKLDLDKDDVEKEEIQRKREQQQRDIAKRSIVFAVRSLDTGDPMFAANLEQLAEEWIAKDPTWLERSREQTRLAEFQNRNRMPRGAGNSGQTIGANRRNRHLTNSQRQAMGLASEWLAYKFLLKHHDGYVDESCWKSENRSQFFGGPKGDDAAGYDFLVTTPQTEWLYEVKSSLEDSAEFELTANELRVAGSVSKDGRRKYRILYVPHVFSPDKWCVLRLPNPMGERSRNKFIVVGSGSVRLRFKRR